MSGPPKDYVEVQERILEFREKHPEGSLQCDIVELRDDLVVVKAWAYRTPDDPRPGTGLAAEPIPGKTNFTRDSEVMNAETSAWGRALIAVGAADAKRGIASANEIRSRQQQANESNGRPAKKAAAKKAAAPARDWTEVSEWPDPLTDKQAKFAILAFADNKDQAEKWWHEFGTSGVESVAAKDLRAHLVAMGVAETELGMEPFEVSS